MSIAPFFGEESPKIVPYTRVEDPTKDWLKSYGLEVLRIRNVTLFMD